MLSIAGYDGLGDSEGRDVILDATRRIENRVESLQRDVGALTDSNAAPEPAVDMSATLKSVLWKMFPPSIYVLMVGFILNAMDLNGTLALLSYSLVALGGGWVTQALAVCDNLARDAGLGRLAGC